MGGDTSDGGANELSVWEAIQTFETILEVFPEDVSALESLAVAYEQAGDATRAREKNLSLAQLHSRQLEWEKVHQICQHLIEQNPDDAEARGLCNEAEQALGTSGGAAALDAGAGASAAPVVKLSFDLRGELELAWFLLQNSMITQEQYEAAIEGLTESRMNPAGEASLSLLQELRAMEKVDMDKITDFLCAETGTPYVELTRYEIGGDVATLIPLDQCRRLGILPFARLGDELMVAVLNPVDKEMRGVISSHLNSRIHVYLTSPDDFQEVLTKLEAEFQKKAPEE